MVPQEPGDRRGPALPLAHSFDHPRPFDDECRRVEGRPPERVSSDRRRGHMRNPGTAAVLSAIIPGIGQFYNGDFLRGIFWLIVTPGMWIGTGGMLGWVCHVFASCKADH